ncbi:hypothetical protein BMF77_00240 [Dolichospermum sp. UHCC 0315A]|jgi:hypothetical protein|uniref:FHA domain-containing protein n=1 Tax=Dolichospermum sp. UHCC 0315A TaxID=1914871 RepID=UPI0011E6164A|nr:FHA domain-containing protein [Dolichospermum sp. UHCC 0315A]QEI39687.1 hypothetical protein BMF77_00240 [Dolichospermum sp. UHCC 0315A]
MSTNSLTWAITFQWYDSGNQKIQQKQISQTQVAKHNGIIIIGRDPNVCDLVLNNQSVSSQQAEIYFNEEQQQFFIKNKNTVNTTTIDGNDLALNKELLVNNGSLIILGQQQIKITEIKIYPLPPTNYSGISPTSGLTGSDSKPLINNLNISPDSSTKANTDDKKNSWTDKQIVIAIATVAAAVVTALSGWYVNDSNHKTETDKAKITARLNEDTEKTKLKYEKEKQEINLKHEQEKLYSERFTKHQEKVASLKEKNPKYNQLRLINNCPETLSIAATFLALDDVQQTKGWLYIKRGGEISPDYFTRSDNIYLYATTNNNGKEIVLKGNAFVNRFIKKEDFDYIGDAFIESNMTKELVKFYQIKFDSQSDGYTTKTFICDDEDRLELK